MTEIVKKNRKTIVIIVVLLTIANILNVLAPYLLKLIIDEFSRNILFNSVIKILLAFIVVRILIIIVQAIKNRITNKLSNKMLNELREKIFNKVLSINLSTFTKFQSSDLYMRLTVDAENVKTLFSDNIPLFLSDAMNVLFMLLVMFMINIKLAIIAGITILIIGIISFFLIKKVRNIQKEILLERDFQSQQYSESYNKSKITKLFSLEEKNIKKVNKLLNEELRAQKKSIFYNSFTWPTGVFLEAVGIYVILYYVLNIDISISLGTVYIFLYYIQKCFEPLKEIFNQIEEIQNAIVSLERINKLIEIKEKEDIKQGLHIAKINGNIEFQNVTFAYGKNEVLSNVSFQIKQGEKVAIIGKTGAGKTTITQILMRLYSIKDGNIIIDGHNLEDVSIESIRNNITYISQNAYIFKDTVRKNILLEKQDITDDEILKIIEEIGAMPLLERLEHGLDEVININRMSKGELQIIAFIRAIIHKANIYIFDEPTSNIDLRTEKMIQNIIDKISQKSTVIIIAHRLATIQNVDKILKLRDGIIEEYS